MSAKVVATLAVFWALVQQIGAFMAGGYVAGRMRSRWAETGDEADFRDGLHGGLVWAVGVAIGAFIFLSTAGAAVRTGADVAGKAGVAAAADDTQRAQRKTERLARLQVQGQQSGELVAAPRGHDGKASPAAVSGPPRTLPRP
jgi:hypothetical protein